MSYSIEQNGLHFTVDYYVELLGVLYILCQDQDAVCEAGCPQCNEEYVAEVREFFKDANYSHLTKTLERFSDEYWFNYDAPVRLMLMLSNGYPIDKESLFHERKYIPDDLFDAFLADLAQFENESDFASFYAAHLPMYETIAAHFTADYQRYNSHAFLLFYLQIDPTHEYYINFMVGITNANYGATVGNRVYCNICPYHETRYGPLPDYSYHPIYYSPLVLHEFAHSFVNSAVAQHRSLIQKIDAEKYREDLEQGCYGDSIETLINETIIRALECLYVREQFPEKYEVYVTYNVDEGYSNLRSTIRLLTSPVDFERIIRAFQ